jgi:hypothetical protein
MEAALGTEHGTEHRHAQHRRDTVISAVIPGRPQEKRLDDEESGEKTGAPSYRRILVTCGVRRQLFETAI